MKSIFRIEHEVNKYGPYTAQVDFPCTAIEYFQDKHPGPGQDGIPFTGYHDFFGFANLKQLFAWFKWTDVFRWRRRGFKVYVYKVDDSYIKFGGHQVAFARSEAKYRGEVSPYVLARHLVKLPLLSS